MKKLIIITIIIVVLAWLLLIGEHYWGRLMNRFCFADFGRWHNIKVQGNDGHVGLYVYGGFRGKSLNYHQNRIYYYHATKKYFYAITKWDDYIIISLLNNKVLWDTDNIEDLPEEHKIIFDHIETFKDLRKYNYNNRTSHSFGDGTVYLWKTSADSVWLFSERIEDKLIHSKIKEFKLTDNFLYLISMDDIYAVVDYQTYEVLWESEMINDLPNEHQREFSMGKFQSALDVE